MNKTEEREINKALRRDVKGYYKMEPLEKFHVERRQHMNPTPAELLEAYLRAITQNKLP